ncbi:MAG: Asp23/Gls24 family envelope stress response protein [Clostridiales Family XIII bacterium]|jgi:uncharacterized alkaline shock family protein YloU|nr:Asp23/Gls24 family envelope stress response protein [Clostridiales Family XIII bacterium]
MVKTNEVSGYGTVTISEDVVAACVRDAVLRTKGIHDLFGGIPDALSQNILRKELKFKGIKISEEEEGLVIDVQVVVDYGVKIPAAAWELQRTVKKELEGMTDAVVKAVNIGVQGVHFPARKAGKDAQE